MPTTQEVKEQGMNFSEIITTLVKQNEEQTLYIVELNTQNMPPNITPAQASQQVKKIMGTTFFYAAFCVMLISAILFFWLVKIWIAIARNRHR